MMDIERLKELREETEQYRAVADDRCMSTNYEDDLLALIDEAIASQSVTSEEVQIEINRLQESLNQTKEAADELKGKKYAVNMKPVYDQIKSLELQITALQAYQPWVSVEDEKPESGKHVLLCCEIRPLGKRYVCDGYYAKPKSIIGGYDGECSTEYDEETDEYYLLEGYYEVIKNWGDYSSIAIDDFVVAWKSLPAPPKGE